MFFQIKEDILLCRDFRMNYIRFGRGKKNLVLLQGLSTRDIKGAGLGLAYLYRLFAKEYQVYFFDRREDLPVGMTVRDMASDLAVAMDSLGIKKADLVGISQGGMIAQYLALDRPDLVNKLVLGLTLSRNNTTVQQVVSKWISLAEAQAWSNLTKDMIEKMYSPAKAKLYTIFLPLITILQKPKDPQRFIRMAQAALTCQTYEDLSKISCPCLVLGSKEDLVLTGRASEEMAQGLNCQIYLYDKLGHAAYQEAKDFNQRIYDFLRQENCSAQG